VADALLKVEGLTKRFGGVIASDNVGLDVKPPSSAQTAPARPR
jgi:ABC-type branched-subunit amino acid transport system ATPase component